MALPNPILIASSVFLESQAKPLKLNMLIPRWAHLIYTDMVHLASVQLNRGSFIN